MAVLLARCSALQSKQGSVVWCWECDQRDKQRWYSEVILTPHPPTLPIGNYLAAVLANLCTMGKWESVHENRANREKSDLAWPQLQNSAKYPWATRKGQVSKQPTQATLEMVLKSQITWLKSTCVSAGSGGRQLHSAIKKKYLSSYLH